MARDATVITSLTDDRVAPYRALKERELARDGGRFIAEGEFVVRRLIDSSFQTESVLLSTRRMAEISPIVPEHVPIYVASDEIIKNILGYRFHSGMMAVGLRGPRRTLDDTLSRDANELRLVICPNIANTENLGGLIRIAAGFGIDAMILGPESCDPFFRRCVRVSMGTIFRLPIIQSLDVARDLQKLRNVWNVELIATVVDNNQTSNNSSPSQPLAEARGSGRWALLFGNEAQGLPREIVERCDRRVTIPMKLGTDSLNVMVAAGIFLYQFTKGSMG